MEDQDPPAVVVIKDLKTEKNKEAKRKNRQSSNLKRRYRLTRTASTFEVLSLKTREKKESVLSTGPGLSSKAATGCTMMIPSNWKKKKKRARKTKKRERQTKADHKKLSRKTGTQRERRQREEQQTEGLGLSD